MKDRIKKVRNDADISQAEFSKRILVGSSTVAMWELGTRSPKDIHIEKICEEFDINENWLRTGEGKMRKEKSIEEQTYARFGRIMEKSNPIKKNIATMLLAMVDTLPDDQWEYIYEEFKTCIERVESEKES